MTLSSTPQDDDPLIEPRKGPLGETIFTGSPLFMRFLNDLSDFLTINSTDKALEAEALHTKQELHYQLLGLAQELERIERGAQLSYEVQVYVARLQVELNTLASNYRTLAHECAGLLADNSRLAMKLEDLERRLSNQEHANVT